MKKTAKVSGSNNGFKPVLPRKKRRDSVLEDGSGSGSVGSKIQNSRSWDSETGDTTEPNSIDMEEECLMKKTSFDYGKSGALAERDPNQTLTGSKVKTKKALGKPLSKINFLSSDIDDDVLLDAPVELPPSLKKNLVNISVHKSFALDIRLDKMKIIFKNQWFWRGASILSKFARIIKALFTSKSSLVQTSKKAKEAKILVNTNLKKSPEHSDWAVVVKEISVETLAETKAVVEFKWIDHANLVTAKWFILIGKNTVCVARSDMDKEIWNKRNIHRALLYTLPMETNAHDIWDYVNSVGEKTCTIDCYPVTYARARCAIVCFKLAKSLDAVMNTTPVLRSKTNHILLSCFVGKNFSSGKFSHRVLSDVDKSRLGAIYSKHLAFIAHPNVLINSGFSSEMKSTFSVTFDIEKKFAVLESSLTSLAEQISELAKRLDLFILANQMGNIVMGEGSSVATSSKTAVLLESFSSSNMVKFENMLEGLSISVLSLSVHLNSLVLAGSITTCNVRSMNNPTKQENIIMNKFDGVRIFSSGVDKGFLEAGVAIIINNSLVHHVSKIDKISVMVLGLYTGTSFGIKFGQTMKVNSFVTRALNSSTFVVLSGDFNENNSKKSASYKFCLDLSLANSFSTHLLIVASVSNYFDTNHKTVMVSVNLNGLLDVHLNGLYKQINKNQWKFKITDADGPKWACFKECSLVKFSFVVNEFLVASDGRNFDSMWFLLVKVLVNSTNEAFSRHWFRKVKCFSNKQSLKFFKLEFLVAKLVKSLQFGNASRTGFFLMPG
ncbi:hypothetical protein G9A89_003450 [Geosiphon pyriformis]|nr:hypothetical protein G9A89_003450 [Geosiphon pyriformis]